jgi:hypothetical protein
MVFASSLFPPPNLCQYTVLWAQRTRRGALYWRLHLTLDGTSSVPTPRTYRCTASGTSEQIESLGRDSQSSEIDRWLHSHNLSRGQRRPIPTVWTPSPELNIIGMVARPKHGVPLCHSPGLTTAHAHDFEGLIRDEGHMVEESERHEVDLMSEPRRPSCGLQSEDGAEFVRR